MKSILVVDDNNDLRFAIAASLSFAGYDVRQAANGRDAIVLVLAQRPDLILCDVKMPEMDGYRTLAAIRKFPGTATIPFVLMMGTADWDESRQAMIRGADDCLMKPFSIAQMIEVVEARLARSIQVRREAYQQNEEPHGETFLQFSPAAAPAAAGMALASSI
jgi:CheY-like chemotaxis protein